MIPALTKLKDTPLQYLAVTSGALNMFSCGLKIGWPSPYLPLLLDDNSAIPITQSEGSWIAILVLFGAIFGSITSSFIVDRFGRKKLLLFSNFPFIISWLIMAFATSLEELYISRFVGGLSFGIIFSSFPIYLSEVANQNVRGLFLSALSVSFLCGVLVINITGSYLSIQQVSLINIAFPILAFLVFIHLPDTPYYYLLKGMTEQAKESIHRYRGAIKVDDEIQRISGAVCEVRNTKDALKNLFMKKNSRKVICVVLMLYFAQQWSGIYSFTFYLPIILKHSEIFIHPITSSSIFYTLQIVASFISMVIVDKAGRKPLLILSVIIVSVSLLCVGIFFALQDLHSMDLSSLSWIPLIGFFLYITGYGVGLSTVPITYFGESFPIGAKAFAGSFSEISFCIFSTLASKFFQYTNDKFGLYVPCLTFAFCSIFSLIFIICFLNETKLKTLEEIQTDLKHQTNTNTITTL